MTSALVILALCAVILPAGLLWSVRLLRARVDTLLREKDLAYSFLHDVGDVLATRASVDVDTLAERVLFYAQRATKAEAGAIYLLDADGETLRAKAVSGTFPPIVNGLPKATGGSQARLEEIKSMVLEQTARTGAGLVGSVLGTNTAILVETAELDARIPRFEEEFLQIHSILLVPMHFYDEPIGVLAVVNRVDEKPFTETDQSLLQSLADQASVSIHFMAQSAALEEKRSMDRDLAIAREIQAALLPKEIPTAAGVEFAAFSEPARGIGGDYYDFFTVDDRHIGIAIADVSGKGISASIVMSIFRSLLRTQAPGNLSPAAVLRAVNRVISKDLSKDIFISVLYMLLNTDTLRLKVARAGHLRPFVFTSRRGAPLVIDSGGMAVGIADADLFDEALAEQNTALQPGDTMTAYTDGVTDAMDRSQSPWTTARLTATIQSTVDAGGRACDVAENVRLRLLDYVGNTPQYDDMTLVVLQVGREAKL